MARIAYADVNQPEILELVDRINRERASLPNLCRMLLNSPPIAEGWLNYLTAIRQKSGLCPWIREMLILRVAMLNKADYEFEQHLPIALNHGCTERQIKALQSGDLGGLDGKARAAIAYCDAITRDIRVEEAIFSQMRSAFDDKEIVEITATVGAYNMVSRFLGALQVDHE